MPVLPLAAPPKSLCLFRLSALGDCANILPIVHTLQKHWPQTHLTWVIGEASIGLVEDLPGVEFVVLDKKAGRRGRLAIREQLKGRKFDALLHMHAGLRANLATRMIPAEVRLGFNPERSRDLHGWFVNQRIDPPAGLHVLDGFFGFLDKLGLGERELDWSLPIPEDAREQARQLLPGDSPVLLISPCSSHTMRNWLPDRYAQIADYAAAKLGLHVVLIGGPSDVERQMGEAISEQAQQPLTNLIGRTSLKTLLALLERGQILISPDSGPAHMANITDTPTIALHAATDSRRGGPYKNLDWAVDCYDQAAQKILGKLASELKWGKKIEKPGVMEVISVADVRAKLDALWQHLNQ